MKIELERNEITDALNEYVSGLFGRKFVCNEQDYNLPRSLEFVVAPEDAPKDAE